MNVVIAAASGASQLDGVQRHAINLARCLLTREEITQVHLIVAHWQHEFVLDNIMDAILGCGGRLQIHAVPITNHVISRNLWFYLRLPKLAAQLGADVVHLAYPVPVAKSAFHCPIVVTLHDLYPYDIPDNFGFPKVFFNRAVLRQCLRAADAIACVSHSTYAGLKKLEPQRARKRAVVIYNCVEAQEQFTQCKNSFPKFSGTPLLLCVAQHRRNKNILLALRVFDRLVQAQALRQSSWMARAQMLIVGIPGPETEAIERFIARAGLTDRVSLVNGISDEQLQWCYRNCSVLLAPSRIEGFGLPVAEALLAGCSVVCSDIPAFRELGGDHCHYIPLGPQAEEAFANAVVATVDNGHPVRMSMPQLSASVIADQYMRLYRSLLPAPAAIEVAHSSTFITSKERQHLS
jgi:glycosyltransferase involved in cell wall biosynthesis